MLSLSALGVFAHYGSDQRKQEHPFCAVLRISALSPRRFRRSGPYCANTLNAQAVHNQHLKEPA